MELLQSNATSLKDVIEATESLVTIAAIFIGAVWAYRMFWLRRQKYPRVSISYRVETEALTSDTNLLNIIVTLMNDGDVLVRLRSSDLWIQQILPLDPELQKLVTNKKDIGTVLRELIPDESRQLWQTEIAWPLIARQAVEFKSWHKKEIEPKNSLQVRYDFVIDKEIEVVKIYGFYENAAKRPRRVSSSRWRTFSARKHIVGWENAMIFRIAKNTPQ